MSTLKTTIDPALVLSYLKENFNSEIETIDFVKGGQISQAFSFSSNGQNLIIRVNKSARNFKKDLYAYNTFANNDILIPRIIEIGQLSESFAYAISEKAEGDTANDITPDEYKATIPELIKTLDAIHESDVSDAIGYGKWNPEGVGDLESWREFIAAVGKHYNPSELFVTSFLEKEVWEKIYKEMERLAEFCPEEKYLVHGDYAADNIVIADNKVAGVLDWADSMYGDFLYDVALISFWTGVTDKDKIIENHYRSMNLPNFEERILCYKLRVGLSSIAFYGASNQEEKYNNTKERVLRLLK